MERIALTETRHDRQPALIVDFTKVQSDNPHRFVLGFYKGWCGSDKVFGGSPYDEGFEHGVAVREGKEDMPVWCFSPEADDFDGDTIFDHADQSAS